MSHSYKPTPGPWSADRWRVCANFNEGDPPIKVICDTANNAKTRNDENAANAYLIASAPAADLLLRMILSGAASVDQYTKEIRFNGLRFSASDGDWNAIVGIMGWRQCRAALGKTFPLKA